MTKVARARRTPAESERTSGDACVSVNGAWLSVARHGVCCGSLSLSRGAAVSAPAHQRWRAVRAGSARVVLVLVLVLVLVVYVVVVVVAVVVIVLLVVVP